MQFSLEDLEKIVAARAASGDCFVLYRQARFARHGKGGAEAWRRGGRDRHRRCPEDNQGLISESADLLYHLLVVLKLADIPLTDVMAELESRTKQTGLEEKASRPKY